MGIGSKDTGNDDHYDGFLDECRIASTLRTANWIRAQHYSMDDNFIKFSSPPEAIIWQVEGNDFNAAALPSFSYSADGNLTIRFWATDSNDNDLNFNMWYDTSANTKTNRITNDINLSTNLDAGNCDTNNRKGMICTWDWNISGIADNNYWITIEINDGTDTNTITTEKSFHVNPEVVILDVNVWNIDGYDASGAMPSFSYSTDGNLTFDFNVSTATNFEQHTADINYSTTQAEGTPGTVIWEDLNIDGNYCRTNLIRGYELTGTDGNLIVYYKFDGEEDDYNVNRAFDYSTKEHHGQYIGASTNNNKEGKWDTNALFGYAAGDHYVDTGNNASLNFNANQGQYTWMGWFKSSSISTAQAIIDKCDGESSGNGSGIGIHLNSSKLQVYNGYAQPYVAASGTLASNVWYHFAVTYRCIDVGAPLCTVGDVNIYINGVWQDNAGGNWADDTTRHLYIGGIPTGPSFPCGGSALYFNGTIEEIKIYDTTLTQGQIGQDYNYSYMNRRVCSYDWNIMGIADNNYYTNIRVEDDSGNTDFNSSNNSFHVNPVATDDCTCPSSGHWIIDDSSDCTLKTSCNLSGGNLHIVNGSLTIGSAGELYVPGGYNIVIEQSTGAKLIVESGGKVVVYKSGASPFIYMLREGEYWKVSDFIAGATEKGKEYTSFTDITGTETVNGKIRLKITEELDETTYLDRVFLRVDEDDSKIIELHSISGADKGLLEKSDNRYLVIPEGTQHFLEFNNPENYSVLEFGAEGYYIEKPEKKKAVIAGIAQEKEFNPIWPIGLLFAYLVTLIALKFDSTEVKKQMGEHEVKNQNKILGKIAQIKKKIEYNVISQKEEETVVTKTGENMLSQASKHRIGLCSNNIHNLRVVALAGLLLLTLTCLPTAGAVPEIFSIQGRLTNDNNTPLTDDYAFRFIVYDAATGGNLLWSESRTVGVINGYFNQIIGDVNTAKTFNEIDFNVSKWLEIEVAGEIQTPRIKLGSISGAMRAQIANDLNSTGDSNANNLAATNIFATNFYGSGANLTGIVSDVNSADIAPANVLVDNNMIAYGNIKTPDLNTTSTTATAFFGNLYGAILDITGDANFTGIETNDLYTTNISSTGDINANSVTASMYFGDGSQLTNVVMDYSDLNAHFVPYIGADFDVNIGAYGIKAFGDSNVHTLASSNSIFIKTSGAASNTTPGIKFDAGSASGFTPGLYMNMEAGHEKERLDLGWTGSGGGNFELYSKNDATRPGEFRVVYGGDTSYGHVQFTHYNGTQWYVNSGMDENGRFIVGYNDFYFPGKSPSAVVAPLYPFQVYNEGTTEVMHVTTTGDGNFTGSVQATTFFGSGADLTGITTDVNDTDIQPDNVIIDNNLLVYGDANFALGVEASGFFGDGSGLTGVTSSLSADANTIIDIRAKTQDTNADTACTGASQFLSGTGVCVDVNTGRYLVSDINAAFVPYIGADFDTDLGTYDIEAYDINATNFIRGAKFISSAATIASGANAVALGNTTTASGDYSTAMGYNTTASGSGGTALGVSTVASGGSSLAAGGTSVASGSQSISMGNNSTASATASIALGNNAVSSESYSVALGNWTRSAGLGSIAGGYTVGAAPLIFAIGSGAIALGYSDTNMVAGDAAADKGAIALGYNVQALAEASVTLGKDLTNYNTNSVLIQDLNALGDANINSLTATYYGSGTNLTGITSSPNADTNTIIDIRAKAQDTNADSACSGASQFLSGTGICIDVNTGRYLVSDINAAFVPYIGADYDVNLGAYGIKAQQLDIVIGDVTFGGDSNIFVWDASDGYVGIGIAAPTMPLYIQQALEGTGVTQLRLENAVVSPAASTEAGMEFYSTYIGEMGTRQSGRIYTTVDGGAYTDARLTFQSVQGGPVYTDTLNIKNARVGIGTTNPQTELQVIGGTNVSGDLNVGMDLNVSGDVNVDGSVEATAFYGSGADLTGVLTLTDGNKHYVPYIGADFDTDLGTHDIEAFDINATNFIRGAKFISSAATIASGDNAVALGIITTASGQYSTAMGGSTTASGANSTAMGDSTTASGANSTAMGDSTDASGDESTAMGASTTASGERSTAMGASTTASGDYSIATGLNTTASGAISTAMGYFSRAVGQGSLAAGNGASGKGPFAIGIGAIALGYSDTNMVAGDTAADKGAIALGYNVKSLGQASIALGQNVIANTSNSIVIGKDMNAYIANQVLMQDLNALGDANINSLTATYYGSGTNLTGITADINDTDIQPDNVIIDNNLLVYGDANFAQGIEATGFYGDGSALTGVLTLTDANKHYVPYIGADYDVNLNTHGLKSYGTIQGRKFKGADANSVFGIDAIALGYKTTAFGNYSTALGYYTTASGAGSVVGGYAYSSGSTSLTASNTGSVAFGSAHDSEGTAYITSSGEGSLAAGYSYANGGGTTNVTASGDGAIAMGYVTETDGQTHSILSEGEGSISLGTETHAHNDGSVAIGYLADASADYAVAIGYNVFNPTTKTVALGQDVNIANDLNVIGNVAINGKLFGGSPLEVATDINVSDGYQGVSISSDMNRVCFSSRCEMYIDYNGTAFVFGSG